MASGNTLTSLRLWTLASHIRADEIGDHARQVETDGWGGLVIPDNQNLWGDPFVGMTVAAASTSRLLFTTGATNPATRHPAVLAATVASVGLASGQRAALGIARGDSALAHLGGAPVSVADFEEYVRLTRRYLHGDAITFEEIASWRRSPPVAQLALAHAPPDSRIAWLSPDVPPVPITVYASGPKTIAVGARYADSLMFGLGADIDRLRWGIDLARRSREEAGLDPAGLRLGAGMSVGVADDPALARALVANTVASSARFSALHGSVAGPVSAMKQEVYQRIVASYDMTKHGESGEQVTMLTDPFIDQFAVVGTAERCIQRLDELQGMGIDEILIAPPRNDVDPVARAESYDALIHAVLPAISHRVG
jgi:5,10-methylenetetrahydromethanopterin reductase